MNSRFQIATLPHFRVAYHFGQHTDLSAHGGLLREPAMTAQGSQNDTLPHFPAKLFTKLDFTAFCRKITSFGTFYIRNFAP